ncbi:MAG: DinB family protein [Acidobacteriota bacterium]
MSIAQTMLPEYDHEMANTRKYIEHAPEGHNDWKPHGKSMSLGELISHMVELPAWLQSTMSETELDMAPVGGEPYKTQQLDSKEAMLEAFDRGVAAGREALAGASDQDLMVEWTLKSGGHTIMSMPRVAVYRSFVMNHLFHHRGQLGVYYRLLDAPVPAIYGPSADES